MIIAAPTASGKTALLEIALARLFNREFESARAVYIAPVKALVQEKMRAWHQIIFQRVGVRVREFTGDSDLEWGELKKAQLIVTTPEKWDSLTRRWVENRWLLKEVRLVRVTFAYFSASC